MRPKAAHNQALRGALPDNYFSRLWLDASKLAALIDSINNIDTVADHEQDVVGRVYELTGSNSQLLYPKMVLSMDKVWGEERDGIIRKNLIDFLLE